MSDFRGRNFEMDAETGMESTPIVICFSLAGNSGCANQKGPWPPPSRYFGKSLSNQPTRCRMNFNGAPNAVDVPEAVSAFAIKKAV